MSAYVRESVLPKILVNGHMFIKEGLRAYMHVCSRE